MNNLYGIFHEYEEDGGFGDAVHCSDLVALCESKELAEEYVKKHSKQIVYDTPYDALTCGYLMVENLGDMLMVTKDTMDQSPFNDRWKRYMNEANEDA